MRNTTLDDVREWFNRLSYKDMEFLINFDFKNEYTFGVMLKMPVKDVRDGTPTHLYWTESVPMERWQVWSDEDRLTRVRYMIAAIEDHERREWLRFDGVAVFDPHYKEKKAVKA